MVGGFTSEGESARCLGDLQQSRCPSPVFWAHRRPQKMKVHLPKDMKLWPLLHGQ